ncbi:MAG TPA: acyl-CoA-binding protein [Flavobacteriaceae bacterium]|jgi:acyl-CoA-binding protein|nr:acyl-CoA-binding protein [Flavobacteriaceae bacterium]HBS12954.1 acyl-CoA-binding protein [Flavobacteriaceae bacterium]
MKELDEKFEKAFEIASTMTQKLPPDIMLKFYAYYKLATKGKMYESPSGKSPLRNAFKINAMFQLKSLNENEAKQKYIDLVEEITTKKIK